mmetsp:Transcript_5933/g.19006  ORF Transcript_5933/g.19006 Transcript_5933/m.19006 type:complete len:252 (+) Transcript_5933:18-773(+)
MQRRAARCERSRPRDGLCGGPDNAVRLRAMLRPEVLTQSRLVPAAQSRRSPLREGRQGHLLRLRGAVRPSTWLGQVLLVVVLGEVEAGLEVGGREDLGGDHRAHAPALCLQCLLVAGLAGLHQVPLLLVEPVEAAAVLRAPVVALAHAGGGVVGLPEPTQDVHKADLLWIVDHLHRLRRSSLAAADLMISRIGCVACCIAHRRGVNATTREPPHALLRSPETAVGEDDHLHVLGPRPLHGRAQDVVLWVDG